MHMPHVWVEIDVNWH